MNGAATNPDFDVVAYAGAQVKLALDATMKLNGENCSGVVAKDISHC